MSCNNPCTRSIRFEFRRKTCRAWAQSCIVLLAGEPGVELDTGQMKIGDGVRPWQELPYVGKHGYGCGCEVPGPDCGCYGSTGGSGGLTGPTGPTGPAGSGNGQTGSVGDLFDYPLVRNIGLHAYINDFTVTNIVFDPVAITLTYTIKIFGNAIYCDVNFEYYPPLVLNSYTYSNIDTTTYNNQITSGQPIHTIRPSYSVIVPSPGNYLVTISIDTQNTWGIGNGSFLSKVVPFTIGDSDPMGPPHIVAPYTYLGVTGTTVAISGIDYFTDGSWVPVPQDGVSFDNMYNVIDNQNFNYNTFSVVKPAYATYNCTDLEYSDGSGGYLPFPHMNGNVHYFNAVPQTLYITGIGPLKANLTNSIAKTNFNIPFFPTVNTWPGTQTFIGYVYPVPDEVTIPLKPGSSSSVLSIKRCTIATVEGTPQTPGLSNIINNAPGTLSTLSSHDPAYYPYDGKFHTDDFTTSLNYTYILTEPAIFATGTKYLLLKLSTQGYLNTFVVNLGANATGVFNIWGLWTSSSTPTTWYDWSIPSNSPGGCGGGSNPGGKYTLQLNTAAAYTIVGDIYVNIKFSGYISKGDIYISNS